jgi:predicted AAA+ superfamily ATPase
MQKAFSFTLEQWLYFGGYPGAAAFIQNPQQWSAYVRDSLIETVLMKDVLQLQKITKPALLRHLFMLTATFPAEILSYNKMLGQLQDAGNTTTLSHYITLLEGAYLVSGLEQYKKGTKIKRGSSPKLIMWNNALITSLSGLSFDQTRNNHSLWGRLVENAVGAHFLNNLSGFSHRLFYWRQGDLEVDFVIQTPKTTYAIEVKSGNKHQMSGVEKFHSLFPDTKTILIGHGGTELEAFFLSNPVDLLQ